MKSDDEIKNILLRMIDDMYDSSITLRAIVGHSKIPRKGTLINEHGK